ncbi:MAG: hypothetical protein JWM47_2821 [Acidimicrobiales bacterium]|nr:hypothetical protein [Acidimicrobiales bacterium]
MTSRSALLVLSVAVAAPVWVTAVPASAGVKPGVQCRPVTESSEEAEAEWQGCIDSFAASCGKGKSVVGDSESGEVTCGAPPAATSPRLPNRSR